MRWTIVLVAGCLALGAPARADDPAVVQVRLAVGETVPLGPAPVRNLICDDASLIDVVDTPAGAGLRGKAAGATLCSFTDATSIRKTCRVTIVAAGPDGGQKTPPAPGYGG
jgi:hypothetical protein